MRDAVNEAFECHGWTTPARPVLISVPHAGRDYRAHPRQLLPNAALRALEDRHADRLADIAIRGGTPALIARTPRLWIDLNRGEEELDPAMIGAQPSGPLNTKVRGGLGLIPRRIGHGGEIWRLPLDTADVSARIETVHRRFHHAIAHGLGAARAQFGAALLIDLHSMPPVVSPEPPTFVIGDRYGASAAPRLTAAAEAALSSTGLRVAINAPYAGGYIATRHADPRGGVHVLQVEVDRARYLDARLDAPGLGLAAMQRAIAQLVAVLEEELLGALPLAAE